MTLAAYDPPWIAALGDARASARSSFQGWTAASPTTKISGWPGIVRSGPTMTRPARSVCGPGRRRDLPGERRRLHAGRPEHGPGRDRLLGRRRASTTRTSSLVDVDRPACSSGRRPRAARAGAAPTPTGPADRAAGRGPCASTRMIRASAGRIAAEIALERVARDLAEGAGELDAGRAAADEHERHPFAAAFRVGLAFGGLERDEDPPADLGRVLDGLEARGERRPLRVVEVAVVRARRDDERVVVDRAAVREQDLALLGVDADGLAEDDGRVAVLAAGSSGAAGRCRRARARRSRPGRASAGTGGSCADRRA